MLRFESPKCQTKRCFAKENSCNKQESQAYDNENTSTSQNVQFAENVSTPRPFPNVSGSFADKNRFHEELEIKLSEELIRYILNDEPKVMLLIILIFHKLLSKWIIFSFLVVFV